jgi:hypothetical protein
VTDNSKDGGRQEYRKAQAPKRWNEKRSWDVNYDRSGSVKRPYAQMPMLLELVHKFRAISAFLIHDNLEGEQLEHRMSRV